MKTSIPLVMTVIAALHTAAMGARVKHQLAKRSDEATAVPD